MVSTRTVPEDLTLEYWMENLPEHTEWVDGKLVEKDPIDARTEILSLEDFIANPPSKMEWVDGKVVEKTGMTFKHGKILLRLGRSWADYIESSGQGGEVCGDSPCRTNKKVRCPDVAYISFELLEQFGDFKTLPQSFPLVAEIVSPTDIGEEVLLKAREYLDSGCLEVWLVFPDSRWMMVITQDRGLMFTSGQTVSSQIVLQGFSIAVDELLA